MRSVLLCLALAACGPVRLGQELGDADADVDPEGEARPRARLTVSPVDCNGCVELLAEGMGAHPPFELEWDDGSRNAQRRVCIKGGESELSVVVIDAEGSRSLPQTTRLQVADAACPPPPEPLLCLENPSFEGMPAINLGLPDKFDAAPWKHCTSNGMGNTPDIANESLAPSFAVLPAPTDGATYLSVNEDEQASQALCEPLRAGALRSLKLDLTRININAGTAPETERVFLEIWGGVAANCSSSERLWASPPLEVGWKTFCVTLQPSAFMDNLVLRGNSDRSLPNPGYLLVDNLVPVASCP